MTCPSGMPDADAGPVPGARPISTTGTLTMSHPTTTATPDRTDDGAGRSSPRSPCAFAR